MYSVAVASLLRTSATSSCRTPPPHSPAIQEGLHEAVVLSQQTHEELREGIGDGSVVVQKLES
eukprot:4487463-Pyramimonas_sp.AAC.1